MKVTIERSNWAAIGNDAANPRMRGITGNEECDDGPLIYLSGKTGMCCLGFVCEAHGVDETKMHQKLMPSALEIPIPHLNCLVEEPHAWFFENTDLAQSASTCNDRSDWSIEQKESYLTSLFAPHGIDLEFV